MIDPARIARVLSHLRDLGAIRRSPNANDVPGEFDAWFDGGAYLVVTGHTTYVFKDRTRAVVTVGPRLNISIKFADDIEVLIQERDAVRPMPPPDWRSQVVAPVCCAGCAEEIAAGSTHKFKNGKPFHMGC